MIKFLIENDMFDGSQMTVTEKTHWENVKDLPGLSEGQDIIRPLSNPIKASGHLQIMYGNVCPGGGVAKITGKEGETFTGVARVYDSEPLMMAGLNNKEIRSGDVVIIRYEGPKGGEGEGCAKLASELKNAHIHFYISLYYIISPRHNHA